MTYNGWYAIKPNQTKSAESHFEIGIVSHPAHVPKG